MLRSCMFSLAVLVLSSGSLLAADEKSDAKGTAGKKVKATITKVDAQKGTVTVKMKDQDGNQVQKTFRLAGEAVLLDNNGKRVRLTEIEIFRSGDEILFVERDGEIREMRKAKGNRKPD